MKKKTTKSSGNVFGDLGFDPAEAAGVGSVWHPAEEFDDMYRGRTRIPKGDIIIYFE